MAIMIDNENKAFEFASGLHRQIIHLNNRMQFTNPVLRQ